MKDEQEFSFSSLFIPFSNFKAILFITIIGCIVFFNSLFNGFVGDDFAQLVENSATHSISNIGTFFSGSTFSFGNGIQGIYYKPLLLTFYSLIYSIFGEHAFFFHFFQLCFHITNAILLFILFKKIISKELSFALSLIFLVHPINQSNAAYISNMQDTMYFFCGMLGLLFVIQPKSKFQYAKVFLMFLLSLLFKETGIVFFAIYLVYLFLFDRKKVKFGLLYSILILVPYFVMHTYAVGTHFATPLDYQISKLPLGRRLMSIPKILEYYLLTFIFPNTLTENYDWVVKEINLLDFVLPLLSFISLIFGISFIALKNLTKDQFKFFLFFLSWFLLGLTPHLQLVPLDSTVSPRWFYLAIVGLLGVIGVFLQRYINKKNSKILYLTLIIVTILLVFRTGIRNNDFKDNVTLTCHDANQTNDNFSLENSCGGSLYLLGQYDEAQKHLERSIALNPNFAQSRYALGLLQGVKSELTKNPALLKDAEQQLKISIQINPTAFWPYDTLGYIYATYEDPALAKEFLSDALKKFPNDPKLWHYLAIAYYRLGDKRSAQDAIQRSYGLVPNDVAVAQFKDDLSNNREIKISQPIFDR